MSIALLIYWIFIKVMVFVESAPKIGDVYYDPLTFDSPDSYPSEDGDAPILRDHPLTFDSPNSYPSENGDAPILRDQSELLHNDARKQFEGYLYDANHCKHINGRILCGYDKNKGQIEEEERIIDMGNGCYSRGDRIECGYGNKPMNKLLRIPVEKVVSSDETSDENHESTIRQTPTRTSLKTVPTTTMTPSREVQPLLLKNNLLKSAISKIPIKPNKIKKKAKKEPTKEKKPTTSTTISTETEITTAGTSTLSSTINNMLPSTKLKINPTSQSSKTYSEVTPTTTKIDIGPLQSAPKIETEQSHTIPNGNVNQTLSTSKMGVDPIPPAPKIDLDLTSSLATKLHIDQTTVSKTETDIPPTLSVNEMDSLSNSDSSEYLSSDTNTNDNIVVIHKNDIDTPAVRNRQSVESLSDEPNENNEDRIRSDPPMDIPETADNDADSEINTNSADTTATVCVEKQDRVVCYNYKTEAYE